MSLGAGAEDKGRPDIIAFFMRKLDERDARVMHLEARLDALEAQLVVERKRPRSDSSGSCDASASARGKRRRRYANSNGESDEEGGHLAVLSAAGSSDGSRFPLLSLPHDIVGNIGTFLPCDAIAKLECCAAHLAPALNEIVRRQATEIFGVPPPVKYINETWGVLARFVMLNARGRMRVSANSSHTIASFDDGRVFSFGSQRYGKLGDGMSSEGGCVWSPQPLALLSSERVLAVATGREHSVGITAGGKMLTWGASSCGQAGGTTTGERLEPTEVLSMQNMHAVSSSCGAFYSTVLTSTGNIFTCGYGPSGELGCGETDCELNPSPVMGPLQGVRVVAISAGYSHVAALSDRGHVYSFGSNDDGELGHGDTDERRLPARVAALVQARQRVVVVACGRSHTVAVTAEGKLFSWGAGKDGRLGQGNEMSQALPTEVPLPTAVSVPASGVLAGRPKQWISCSAGQRHTIAQILDRVGETYTFAWVSELIAAAAAAHPCLPSAHHHPKNAPPLLRSPARLSGSWLLWAARRWGPPGPPRAGRGQSTEAQAVGAVCSALPHCGVRSRGGQALRVGLPRFRPAGAGRGYQGWGRNAPRNGAPLADGNYSQRIAHL